jgi:hypothetical protein
MKNYKKGVPITSIRQLEKVYKEAKNGGGYVFFKERLIHSGFWGNLQFRLVVHWIDCKMLWEAVKGETNGIV